MRMQIPVFKNKFEELLKPYSFSFNGDDWTVIHEENRFRFYKNHSEKSSFESLYQSLSSVDIKAVITETALFEKLNKETVFKILTVVFEGNTISANE